MRQFTSDGNGKTYLHANSFGNRCSHRISRASVVLNLKPMRQVRSPLSDNDDTNPVRFGILSLGGRTPRLSGCPESIVNMMIGRLCVCTFSHEVASTTGKRCPQRPDSSVIVLFDDDKHARNRPRPYACYQQEYSITAESSAF